MASLKLFALLLFFQVLRCQAENEEELKLVIVIHRHGARSPVKTYNNDPYKSAWPEGYSQLTRKGKTIAFELGAYLRKRYDDFLDAHFIPTTAYFRSTDVTRTLMTAQLVGAGVFPAKGFQKWTNESGLYSWSPIPISTVPNIDDKLLRPYNAHCPAAEKAYAKFLNSTKFKKYDEELKPLLERLTKYTRQEITIFNYTRVFDGVTAALYQGLKSKQPSWVTGEIVKELREARDKLATFRAPTKELQRFYGGTLVKKIIEDCHGRIDDSSQIKFYDYSTHDKMVSVTLSTLGIHNGKIPPFAAAIILELRAKNGVKEPKSDDGYFLKVLYRNDSSVDPYPMKIPGCPNDPCTLEEFIKATKDVYLEDFDKACGLGPLKQVSKEILFGLLLSLLG